MLRDVNIRRQVRLARKHDVVLHLVPRIVDLAFTEIRICGAGQPQVTRRLAATLDDLLRITPEERRPQLLVQRSLLERAVAAQGADPESLAFALLPDRQGIG